MNITKYIPNLFTLGNLFCGLIALLFVFQNDIENAAIYVVLGIILDFFDGFLARILRVSGELGKQLDSLADLVTSGVVPGFVMLYLIAENSSSVIRFNALETTTWVGFKVSALSLIGLLITLSAAYRLAKFNIDTKQKDSFIGLPTPAVSLFVISLPLIATYSDFDGIKELLKNNLFLISVTLVLSYLMNANIQLLALKFKSFSWRGNEYRFTLIGLSFILLVFLKILAIPLIIAVYVILSIVQKKQTTF